MDQAMEERRDNDLGSQGEGDGWGVGMAREIRDLAGAKDTGGFGLGGRPESGRRRTESAGDRPCGQRVPSEGDAGDAGLRRSRSASNGPCSSMGWPRTFEKRNDFYDLFRLLVRTSNAVRFHADASTSHLTPPSSAGLRVWRPTCTGCYLAARVNGPPDSFLCAAQPTQMENGRRTADERRSAQMKRNFPARRTYPLPGEDGHSPRLVAR